MLKQKDKYEEEPIVETEEDEELLDGSTDKNFMKYVPYVIGIVVVIVVATIIMSMWNKAPDEPDPNEINIDENPVDYTYRYDEQERELLRNAGYTGYEIEEFEKTEIDPYGKVEEVKKNREEYLREIDMTLRENARDGSSAAYKELEEFTWLGQVPVEVNPGEGKNEFDYSVTQEKENVNYVKIPSRGNQLFLRLEFPEGQVAFMEVHPQTYYTLRDKGNIIVSYDLIIFGDIKYFTNINEVPIQ